jgi:hypothetical protein
VAATYTPSRRYTHRKSYIGDEGLLCAVLLLVGSVALALAVAHQQLSQGADGLEGLAAEAPLSVIPLYNQVFQNDAGYRTSGVVSERLEWPAVLPDGGEGDAHQALRGRMAAAHRPESVERPVLATNCRGAHGSIRSSPQQAWKCALRAVVLPYERSPQVRKSSSRCLMIFLCVEVETNEVTVE